ncbi:hypothetical protein [Streptomyces sp. NPDC048442]|uniref:hypothetical protein n=1 Tax=Streptomyces sp. NPDC048442 TaxID=3154823 RepID=UPI0034208BED
MPSPLVDAMHGRLPAAVRDTVFAELARRSPQQLSDRVERRWHRRWAHAWRERAAENPKKRRWNPDEIALMLVAPGTCPAPDCEDGMRLRSERTCAHCQRPEYRYIADDTVPASAQTQQDALAAIRRALLASPHRTPAADTRPLRTRPGARTGIDRALKQARARLADPATPRAVAPPDRPEPGPADSVILAARTEDPVREAALKRARAERAQRTRKGTP